MDATNTTEKALGETPLNVSDRVRKVLIRNKKGVMSYSLSRGPNGTVWLKGTRGATYLGMKIINGPEGSFWFVNGPSWLKCITFTLKGEVVDLLY